MSHKHDLMPGERHRLQLIEPARSAPANERPTVRVRIVDGITVVEVLNAEILFAAEAIAELAAQLRNLVDTGHPCIMLDFSGVRSMSSDVLGTLAGLHRLLEKIGGRLSLYGPPPVLRDMLRICRLDRVFDIHPVETTCLTRDSSGEDRV